MRVGHCDGENGGDVAQLRGAFSPQHHFLRGGAFQMNSPSGAFHFGQFVVVRQLHGKNSPAKVAGGHLHNARKNAMRNRGQGNNLDGDGAGGIVGVVFFGASSAALVDEVGHFGVGRG